MTSITADSSHGRFSRPGFTFGLKSQSESRDTACGSQRDREDDWYIPYTGPYEPPPEPRSSRTRDRDSWGDPIYAGEATVGGAPRVHYDDSPSDREYSSSASEEGRVRGRERARSVSSSHTTSARPIEASQRRNFLTYHSHQPTLSYTTSDGGGVGESPVPHRRQSKDRQASPRASLASIFTFGVRPPTSPVRADRTVVSPGKTLPFRPNAVSADSAVNRVSSNEHRRTMSGGTASLSTGSRYTAGDQIQSLPSQTTTDEDYYNSYYSTLANVPTKVFGTDFANPPRSRPFIQSTSASPHPYISVSQEAEQSQSSSTHPQSAPPSSSSYEIQPMIPKLTFSETPSNHLNTTYTPRNSSSRGTPRKFIKGSVSTPNFQAVNTRLSGPRRIPKGIERWLSAETWCDALLFPRPRLRLQNESGSGGRAVSPPGSPVVPDPRVTQATESVPSRVLAHSRSLVNMRDSQGGHKPGSPSNLPPTRLNTSSAENADQAGPSNRLRPLRPKSWSSDDLDLPTPVPSLARVLAEGQRLDSERKEWQSRASHSLGNKRARNVSRARSKSLTANGRKTDTQARGHLNYLAARAVHGNQEVIPLVPSMRQKRKSPSQQGSMPRSSQSQSQTQTSSTGRSQTHSSKSDSRDHSRTDSWSKSALKVVQSAPCCDVDATRTPVVENTVPRQKEACKAPLNNDVIASDVADSTCVVGPSTLPLPVIVPSPTPSSTSRITDPRVGIAISTPLTDESLNRDNLRLLSHPYAQGGLYSSPSRELPAEYAGRHPIATATQTAQFSDCSAARQKHSPHALPSHPYAQASSSLDSYDDDLVNYVLAENNAWKMWSPSIDENYNVTGITDTAGVGEILVYAAEQQKDGVSGAKDSDLGSAARMQSVRKVDSAGKLGSRSKLPAQYDVTRQVPPLHLQKAPDTPHTFASSSLEHRITPRIPQFVKDEMAKNLPVPVGGSAESSQSNSPRPLGSPNDLVGFHDLFYKPGGGSLKHRVMQQSSSELSTNSSQYSQTQLSNIPFDLKSPNQGRASGLSTLAHKLSREYEQLSSRERASSQSGDSVAMASPRPSPIRKPTEGSLEFVFEETRPMSTGEQPNAGQGLGLSSFRHQDNIPEDVASVFTTGTDKEVEASEDETEHVHVRNVAALMPAEVASDHRLSYTGQVDDAGISPISRDNPSNSAAPEGLHLLRSSHPLSEGRITSGLQPPLSDNTRSSFYTTASSVSNMSNLSDFPAPPRNHMSLLSAFFNEANGWAPTDAGDAETSYSPQTNDHNRLTFGAGADVEDIVQELSNNPQPF